MNKMLSPIFMFLLLFTVSCVEPEMELNEGELDNAKSIDFSTVSISSNNTNPNAAQIGDTITVYYSSNKTLSNSDVLIQSQKAMVEDLGGNNYKATYTLAASDAEGMITFNIVVKDFKNDVTETINASTDASSVFFDTIIPTVSIVSVSSNNLMSSLAKVGDTISLSFTGSETLQNISVLIDGNTALVSNTGGDNWLATYVMNVGGSSGVLNYSINYQDLGYNAGSNITATTDATSVTFDNVEPTPVISTGESSPTNASPISYSVDFGEDVSGFVLGDIVVGNGTAGSFSGGPQVYTFDVTPAGMGTVKIDIAAGVGEDLASNLSLIATQYSITYDNLGPTPVISTSENNPTNDSTLSYSIDFGETVTGFSLSDISVGNGVKSNFAGTTQVYTFDVTPSGQGSVTVDIAAAVAIDNLSNSSLIATQLALVYDSIGATPVISTSESNPTNDGTLSYSIDFGETVTGFILTDITVGNGTGSNFAGGPQVYSFDVAPTTDGSVTVDIAASVSLDTIGNNNLVATQESLVYDNTNPTPTITNNGSDPTNLASVAYSVDFGESVTGFVFGDVTLVNGVLSNFTGGPQVYTFDLAPLADGPFAANIASSVATDQVGLINLVSGGQAAVSYDGTKPSPTISFTGTSDKIAPLEFTINFGESVSGFVLGDLTLSNATVGNLNGGSTSYTFDVTPTDDGVFTIDMAAGLIADAAGNTNNALSTFTSDTFQLILAGKVGAVRRYVNTRVQKCFMIDNNHGTVTSIVYTSDDAKYEDFKVSPPPSNVIGTTSQSGSGFYTPSEDATIIHSLHPGSTYHTTNYGDYPYQLIQLWTTSGSLTQYHSLIKFDLTGYIPGTTITNASITLSSSADPLFAAYDPYSNTFHGASVGIASATRMWSIHRVTSAWDESTVTWNTAPTFTATNAVTGNSSPATNTDDMTFDVTALVQDMVDSGNHYGFYLKHDGTTAHSSYSFGSKDNKNTCSVAPTLSINPGLF